MTLVMRCLAFVARHGRATLVLGLGMGLVLPDLAAVLKPWIAEMVAGLLFMTAYRIGLPAALGGFSALLDTLKAVLVLQLLLPLAALMGFLLLGMAQTPAAIALILMLSAPSVTGSPNITLLLGHAPEPAFRCLILGTALLPLTVLPIFLLAPELGDFRDVLFSALRLTATISAMAALGFGLRQITAPQLNGSQVQALDGGTTLALAVIVIGLMAAIGPALTHSPALVAKWLVFALVANLGFQVMTYLFLRKIGKPMEAVPLAVIAGNRNFALFLIALPAATTDPLLIFLGCYQVPMYLTAILMRRLYQPPPKNSEA